MLDHIYMMQARVQETWAMAEYEMSRAHQSIVLVSNCMKNLNSRIAIQGKHGLQFDSGQSQSSIQTPLTNQKPSTGQP